MALLKLAHIEEGADAAFNAYSLELDHELSPDGIGYLNVYLPPIRHIPSTPLEQGFPSFQRSTSLLIRFERGNSSLPTKPAERHALSIALFKESVSLVKSVIASVDSNFLK